MYSKGITISALTSLLVTALAVTAWAEADKLAPHKNVPGPARLILYLPIAIAVLLAGWLILSKFLHVF